MGGGNGFVVGDFVFLWLVVFEYVGFMNDFGDIFFLLVGYDVDVGNVFDFFDFVDYVDVDLFVFLFLVFSVFKLFDDVIWDMDVGDVGFDLFGGFGGSYWVDVCENEVFFGVVEVYYFFYVFFEYWNIEDILVLYELCVGCDFFVEMVRVEVVWWCEGVDCGI